MNDVTATMSAVAPDVMATATAISSLDSPPGVSIAINAQKLLQIIGTWNYTGILLFAVLFVFVGFLIKLNRSSKSKFFFDDLLLDENNRASTSKLAQMIALITSTWAFLHITLVGELTEWFFGLYMGIWVLNRSYAKWISTKENKEDPVIT